MLKVQYGIAGFFTGIFIGFLMGLVEMRFIDNAKHPAMLFIVIALTLLACGIAGSRMAISLLKKNTGKEK